MFKKAYTFDDVLLEPAYSEILPKDVQLKTRLTEKLTLNIPVISAAMDTVTESELAVAMAQNGGLGIIHKNMGIKAQAEEVRKVKRFESGMVLDPITITPYATLGEAFSLMEQHKISGIPVVAKDDGILVGILTHRDVRFASNPDTLVKELMTHENLVTAKAHIAPQEAKKILHKHRIEKLLLVDDEGHCTGLMTVKDLQKSRDFPNALKDSHARLKVGAATGTGAQGLERAQALIDAGVDVIVIDTAHGHSRGVIEQVKKVRTYNQDVDIIAGNIATAAAAQALIEAGANMVKVGIGPGSICTTRIVSGVGVPQLSAIMEVAAVCQEKGIGVVADGGIKFSGDVAKAIAVGADCVMVGSLLAGTDETPGEVFLFQGRSYKGYRGMGSAGAMAQGSADRYFQEDTKDQQKFVPEGVEGRVPYKGPVTAVLHQLTGGLRASMGYTGNATIAQMKTGCTLREITNASLRESHVHDVTVTRESPNYRVGG